MSGLKDPYEELEKPCFGLECRRNSRNTSRYLHGPSIIASEFAARPWSKVGADLCDLQGRTLLVVCDYYSNFIEVENITRATTAVVAKALKTMFARYMVPDMLISDNGPQFSSEEFSVFARKWGFEHVTSSPHYPQSNGKAENAVKTCLRSAKSPGNPSFSPSWTGEIHQQKELALVLHRGFWVDGVRLSYL